MKPTFTHHLKSLMLGGAIALAAGQASQAAAVPAQDSPVDARVAKIRESLSASSGGAVLPGQGVDQADPGMMWWRNAWGNGGWHNWGNGWHNWHNGGWGNWHNW